ncbi:MAG TPA: hypothetical protein GXX46_12045 [Peptococcaceae bacterium]|nr:hypothetical protein [Peptococcaceae bacterium]
MSEVKNTGNKIYRPVTVEIAIKLLLTSLVFGALVAYLSISVSPDDKLFAVYTDLILLNLLFNGFIIYKITQNRNWARIFFVLFTIMSIPIFISQLVNTFMQQPFLDLLKLVNIFIQIAAAYMLMKKESKEWFLLAKTKR